MRAKCQIAMLCSDSAQLMLVLLLILKTRVRVTNLKDDQRSHGQEERKS